MNTTSPLRRWAGGWWVAAHLVLDLVVGLWHWVPLLLLLLGAALVPLAGAGIPLLLLARVLLDVSAALERARLRALGVAVEDPGPWERPGPWWRRWLLDPRPWRSAGHLAVVGTAGLVGGAVVLVLAATGLAAVVAPSLARWTSAAPGGLSWPWGSGGPIGVPDAVVGLTGVALLLLVPLLARVLAVPETATGAALLGPPPQQREATLRERVDTLTSTRERAVDSVEEERRRIERDLHDGPQQRLVSLSLQLGMARRALDREGPHAARALLESASSSATAAIADMRRVARGVAPPVLTDRGLDAAVSALAATTPVPVDVEVSPDVSAHGPAGRPSATTEAIAYFCVSEALTNVAKHSGASRALVQLWQEAGASGPRLRVRVQDDGRGGARPGDGPGDGPGVEGGSGLRGLLDRVAAVDGRLAVSSPAGGPTVLDVDLPWRGGGVR
ncbi:sensor histidine kinase [Kineococcus sp. SYSU DK004]|uniref:sensor histidine kinase n=1 Tax=Kineococcus sp. SYSU DK004 TaxID=3383125 RepID=UPI003D7D65B2